ncbi:unnamed protein product [Schistosoma curassoni]|uniref:Oxidored_FMN domain-containing protein n=1 Tax=Schistosoma curassoni TaxID=6186 RepID=A0A183KZN6_9TREM|nr:unnamed protein product [Schistosoma curassoni]
MDGVLNFRLIYSPMVLLQADYLPYNYQINCYHRIMRK